MKGNARAGLHSEREGAAPTQGEGWALPAGGHGRGGVMQERGWRRSLGTMWVFLSRGAEEGLRF